jgi:hypothetical protein
VPSRAAAALFVGSTFLPGALVEPASPVLYDGLYEADGEPRLWVGPFPELGPGQFFLELRSGRFGPLTSAGGGRFVAGPRIDAAEPIDLTVELEAAASGAPNALRYAFAGGPSSVVRRRVPRLADVSFANGRVTLAGSLTLPDGPGPFGAIVLVHGSGPLDRRWFQLWADLFARAGLVALTYDKRGTGSSGGDWKSSDFDDLAGDAIAGLQLLRARRDVDPERIGIWGISQGGWIAPLVASRWPALAFVVLHAGPATTVYEQGLANYEWELRAAGLDDPDIAGSLALVRASLDYNRRPSDESWRAYERAHAAETARGAPWVPPFEARDAWFRAFYGPLLDFDPKPYLERLRCPLLAFFGELDANVPASANRQRLEAALAVAGNRDATIVTLPKANHLFLAAETGTAAEYPTLSRFVPGYFETTTRWLGERFGARHPLTP